MSQTSLDIAKKNLVLQSKFLHFQGLGPKFSVSKILLPQETKQGMKTLLYQSARK
jgi:hypothetical protein